MACPVRVGQEAIQAGKEALRGLPGTWAATGWGQVQELADPQLPESAAVVGGVDLAVRGAVTDRWEGPERMVAAVPPIRFPAVVLRMDRSSFYRF